MSFRLVNDVERVNMYFFFFFPLFLEIVFFWSFACGVVVFGCLDSILLFISHLVSLKFVCCDIFCCYPVNSSWSLAGIFALVTLLFF